MTIRLEDIQVHYTGVKALDGVTVDIRLGEVHGLIGENGAGKSTTMNVLSGGVRPTAGCITIDGESVQFSRPADAVARGVSLVSQEGTLVPHLSGAANICLGFEPTHWGGVILRREMQRLAESSLRRWFPDTEVALDLPVAELPYASQKIIEILRALHAQPRVLILDEPTATLPAREKESLWVLIRKLAVDGVGVVIISHFMAEILQLADRITALQDGKVVCSVVNDKLTERDLVGFMLNRGGNNRASTLYEDEARERPAFVPTGSLPAVAVKDWIGANFGVENFQVESGEIVGLIGLTGSGHTEFASSLFAPRHAVSGSLQVNGQDFSRRSIRALKAAGVAFVPDHRMTNALLGAWTVRENMSLINLRNSASRLLGIIRRRVEMKEAQQIGLQLSVKMASVEQKVAELSGGNKQKVSIGRWLFAAQEQAKVFIFIEPTEGVDIGSKHEIHDLMRSLSARGAAVVVVSSDLLEVSAVADRVVPFRRGRNGRAIAQPEFSEQLFLDAIAGVAA